MCISLVILGFPLMLALSQAAMARDCPEQLPKVVQHAQPAYPPLARVKLTLYSSRWTMISPMHAFRRVSGTLSCTLPFTC